MRTIVTPSGMIVYSDVEHIGEVFPNASKVILRISPEDTASSGFARENNGVFIDRVLGYEINCSSLQESSIPASVAEIVLEHSVSQDMVDLACQSFETDRRFHLGLHYDQEKAREIKIAYISDCMSSGCVAFVCRHGKELLGFTIVDKNTGHGKGVFENVLGVTRPGIRGKMIAVPLYTHMIRHMQTDEMGSMKKYFGWVSAGNVASINLHANLAGRVVSVFDEYIFSGNEWNAAGRNLR